MMDDKKPSHTQSRPRLSKSRYTTGLQCPRLLWWTVHEPDALELTPSPGQQAIFDQGTRVGELAQRYVPGGVLIDFDYEQRDEKVQATRQALDQGANIIYEASFFEHDVFVAIDILARESDGWHLIEVKSSARVKPEHLPDAAVQAFVLRQAGIEPKAIELMHLNRQCRYPSLDDLFVRTDITQDVSELLDGVPGTIDRLLDVLRRPLPDTPIGRHCKKPYECPFQSRCWAHLPRHNVTTIYNSGVRAFKFLDEGYVNLVDVPEDRVAPGPAERQQRAIRSDRMIVESTLRDALEPLASPLGFLDFESINPAVPVWEGCHPYDQVPVQFSYHVERADGNLAHFEHIAEGAPIVEPGVSPGKAADPRRAFAEALIGACWGSEPIVTYNMWFERTLIRELATWLPEYAEPLQAISERIVDLLPIVRDHIYHPDFLGGFGLKAVLPVLVDDTSHDGLAIADGSAASRALERLLVVGEPADEGARVALRRDILAYCAMDTRGLRELLRVLRTLC